MTEEFIEAWAAEASRIQEIQHQILILVNCELYLSLKIKLFDGNLQFLFHPF